MPRCGSSLVDPHKDGWRNEHVFEQAKDDACGAALETIMTAFYTGDVPIKTTYIITSATLIILLKKDVDTMEEMKA